MDIRADRKRMLLEMRDELMQRLEQAQADIDAVNRLLAAHESTERPIVPSTVEEIRQGAMACLTEHGEPMHRQDLLDCLIAQSIHISGKIPVNNLGAILSRYSDDFTSHGQGKWGLKAWQQGANGYRSQDQQPSHSNANEDSMDEKPPPWWRYTRT